VEHVAEDLKREEDQLPKVTDTTARRNSLDRIASLKRIIAEDLSKMKRYRDYREMLDKQKDIDAVVIATPDHMHALIAHAAMDEKKHVYVQKPLTWSVDEARKLAKKAKESRVVTQMGNQGPLRGTTGGARSSGCRPAPSATCAKCTSGRTGHSPTGRKVCRGRSRSGSRLSSDGTCRG
jgi:hypothetical protein